MAEQLKQVGACYSDMLEVLIANANIEVRPIGGHVGGRAPILQNIPSTEREREREQEREREDEVEHVHLATTECIVPNQQGMPSWLAHLRFSLRLAVVNPFKTLEHRNVKH